MLGHRTLNVEDYITILKRRWWIIAIPAIILPIVGFGITFLIKAQYESKTLVLVDQQKVPDAFVKPITSDDLGNRLSSMEQQILSRSSILSIVQKYNLFADEHLSMDDRIDKARKSFRFQVVDPQIPGSRGLPGFNIFFTAEDAHTAQLVCAEITSMFITADLRSRADETKGTKDFLEEQLSAAKQSLDDQDAKLAAFQRQHFGMLPEDAAQNNNILTSLNTQLDTVNQNIQSLEQAQSMDESLLAAQTPPSSTPGSAAGPSQSTQALQKQLDDLLVQKEDLATRYTADYPEVKTVNRQIEDLRKQLAEANSAPAAAVASAASRVDSPNVQGIRLQLRSIQMQIENKKKQQEQIGQQIRSYQARIQSTPEVEEEFKQLTRDYQSSQALYDKLLAQTQNASEATDLENREEGETFNVLDQASLPDSPTFPKRSVFAMGGLAAGIGLGLLIVGLIEYKDTALRSERDIWAFTHLPTLAVIAWSGMVAEGAAEKSGRPKRRFKGKPPSEQLATG